ncbi:tRNA modification GTPase GTPBP3, mitochondrial isoform X3 [Fopius arisanus]|uniref:tRNA modification GTPase GTPBP3, mitochondrial isoform X3 n=1 Tax=Fopius arisanus TaxID=64838 RepID=A0A9R1U4Z0_9HYME|nr:PREDICTED: tRNA modification GTPase GTPBP3, mitochondrial isoform X3 [Fopius arisanus]
MNNYESPMNRTQRQGKCGVAVVRVSGSAAIEALRKMTNLTNPEPRRAFLRKIFDPVTRDVIDKGLCLWFPGPTSFTGEDSVEFQVHGGSAILQAIMSALGKLKFRPAEPGEFTKRAFYNGKLDLTEIEGLADLIHAETEQQRKQALLQADGNLKKLYNNWKAILSKSLAHIEAYIDFSEDDNLEGNILTITNQTIKDLISMISKHLADGRKGEILRVGVRTAIIGRPNVGKSSLMNYLVQRNAVIVTPIAGTTRDVVELNANICGYPVILADTAGLAERTQDIVEIEGIRRAKGYAKHADLIILMIDASSFVASQLDFPEYLKNYINQLEMSEIISADNGLSRNCVIVVNKTDLIEEEVKKELRKIEAVSISCTTEEGFGELMESLEKKFQTICGNPSREDPTISQARHRTHLTNCVEYLEKYLEMSSREKYDMVIAAQQIRNAMRELGKITGDISTEEILDIIFTSFCIGK